MKRFIGVCMGSTALALGMVIAPAAAGAANAAGPGQLSSHSLKAADHHTVNFMAVSREAPASHPAVPPKTLEADPSAVAAQRAAAARTGGRKSGVIAVAAPKSSAAQTPAAQTPAAQTPAARAAAAQAPAASAAAAAASAAPTKLADFPVMSQAQQQSDLGTDQDVEPPDAQLAAGPDDLAEATNDSLSFWSETGTLLGDADLNAFFAVPSGQTFGDPNLEYDAESGHWFLSGMSMDSAETSSTLYIAISDTSDPGGSWGYYTYPLAAGELVNRPMIGSCSDKVVLTWDDYSDSSGNPAFDGSGVLVWLKSDLIAGVDNPRYGAELDDEFGLVPARSLSPTSTCWLTANDSDPALLPSFAKDPVGTIGVVSVTGQPTSTGSGLTFGEGTPSITPTSPAPAPSQPGGTLQDTSNDDRFVSAVWQDNQLWTTATDACTPSGDTTARNCLRLIDVSTARSTPAVVHDEDLGTSGLDEYYPAASLSYTGDVFVSYSASSSTQSPGAYAISSPSSSGTSFSAPVTIEAGSAAYPGTSWGNYSAAAPDPAEPGAVWVGADYSPSGAATAGWATGAAELTLSADPDVAVSALATNGVPYAQAPLGSGWYDLGGHLTAVPAVVAVTGPDAAKPAADPLFIGPGTNHLLYIRGASGSWVRLGPNDISCLSAAAAVTNNVIQVACEGTNHGLSYNTAVVPSSGLPQFTSKWKSLGGIGTIAAGPAVARVGGTLTFFVLATDGKIHTRTTTGTFGPGIFSCLGQPAASTVPGPGETYFACEGNNHDLYQSTNSGSGWGTTVRLNGTMLSGPAIAAGSRVPVLVLENTNHEVYAGTAATSYVKLGTLKVAGVEAAALN